MARKKKAARLGTRRWRTTKRAADPPKAESHRHREAEGPATARTLVVCALSFSLWCPVTGSHRIPSRNGTYRSLG